MIAALPATEADILSRLMAPEQADFSREQATALLKLKFDAATTDSISRLLRANNAGTITAEERLALDRYLRVGQFIDLLQAKARLSLAASPA